MSSRAARFQDCFIGRDQLVEKKSQLIILRRDISQFINVRHLDIEIVQQYKCDGCGEDIYCDVSEGWPEWRSCFKMLKYPLSSWWIESVELLRIIVQCDCPVTPRSTCPAVLLTEEEEGGHWPTLVLAGWIYKCLSIWASSSSQEPCSPGLVW